MTACNRSASRRTALDYAHRASIAYEYDAASRLLEIDNQTNSGYHRYGYTYDKVGNRTTMVVSDGSGSKTHVYSYDNIYQLTDVKFQDDMGAWGREGLRAIQSADPCMAWR